MRNFGKDYDCNKNLIQGNKSSTDETTALYKYSHPFSEKLGMKEGFLPRRARANCLTSPCHLVDNRPPLPPCRPAELWSIAGVQPKPCCEVLEFSSLPGRCLGIGVLSVVGAPARCWHEEESPAAHLPA